ncbi:MAG: hypothetical protein IKS13_10560 [Ruminococcus sp.]|nr:hypothetical protein [Ruminococcus sp.]
MKKELLKQQILDVIDKTKFDDNEILSEIANVLKIYHGDDFDCVEKITAILEENGYDCGNCHDF